MNTRWREIAVNCWDERTDGLHFDQEMFAKLIVKECAEMGDNFDGQPAGNAVRKYLTAGDAIREYFGVEE